MLPWQHYYYYIILSNENSFLMVFILVNYKNLVYYTHRFKYYLILYALILIEIIIF